MHEQCIYTRPFFKQPGNDASFTCAGIAIWLLDAFAALCMRRL